MEARRFRSGSRTTLSAIFPLKRPSNASFTRRTFRCNCRTASSLPLALRPSLPDKGHLLRPLRRRSDGAGAKAIPDARRADGAPQQARTSPGKAGKVRADAPRDTRRTGYCPIKETAFALPQKGEYGGAGGVEGNFPLSPHAPRRAGDQPPVPGSSRRPRPPNDACGRKAARPLPPLFPHKKILLFPLP